MDSSVLTGTDFQGYSNVFSGAWSRITRAIETAYRHGMGVLIGASVGRMFVRIDDVDVCKDLHAAPGKQNADAHSGTSNEPKFFSDRHCRTHTTQILCSLAVNLAKFANSHSPPLPNVIGIELLNEPRPTSDDELKKWYTATIKELRHIDGNIPIYVGDCWRIDSYAAYMNSLFDSRRVSGLVALDHHLYRCFTDSDIHTSANEHARALRDRMPDVFSRVAEKLGRVHGGLIVGEWSAALNPGSLMGEEDEVKNYVSAQLELYERYCAGWYFWTYKKQQRPDAGWCLIDAVEAEVFPPKVGMTAKKWPCGDERRREDVKEAMGRQAHGGYDGIGERYRWDSLLFSQMGILRIGPSIRVDMNMSDSRLGFLMGGMMPISFSRAAYMVGVYLRLDLGQRGLIKRRVNTVAITGSMSMVFYRGYWQRRETLGKYTVYYDINKRRSAIAVHVG